jgi:hypothetical protein
MANIKRANASSITKSGVAIADVPDAPTIGAVADLETGSSATVAYTAAVTGGAVTTFTATSTPGSLTGTGSSPITVSGLTAGTAYTFTVTATNSTGSQTSAASASVTPTLLPLSAYDSIATVSLTGGGSSTITFSSIPATYTHLQIRCLHQNASSSNLAIRLNGDTTGNYAWHQLYGDGSSAGASGYTQDPYGLGTYLYGNWGCSIIDFLDYANTNKYKTVRNIGGTDSNGAGYVGMQSTLWRSTSAINNIVLLTTGGSFMQYSHFALYGIKGN